MTKMPAINTIETPNVQRHQRRKPYKSDTMREAFGSSLNNPNSKRGKLYWLVQRAYDRLSRREDNRHVQNR